MFRGVLLILLLVTFGCGRDKKDKGETFDPCVFPDSLKKVVVTNLKKKCEAVTLADTTSIKKLAVRNINKGDTKLLGKKYASYFKSLEELDISNSPNMPVLPEFVASLPKLKKLNVSKAGITSFKQNISQLKTLTTLIASHNNYENHEPPLAVFSLSNLKVLDMSYSSIRYIDEYIYKLENLEELYLAGNQLMVVPFMLQVMSSLLVVDLRDNLFKPPNWYASYWYESVNDLHNCKEVDTDSVEECKEDMLYNFRCEWWHKLPFKRGKPFRRYKEMTDEEFETFTAEGQHPSKDRCYLWWLNSKYVPSTDSEKVAYQEHTINGKTLREWQVVLPMHTELWGRAWFGFKQLLNMDPCSEVMKYSDTSYAPSSHEIFPEKYHSGEWNKFPLECEKDRYLYE